ncbi:MAG: glycerophosphoryl diester phosphodiesterase membrane domain-containing protein, partial [Planctomycetota bacterium]
MLEIVWDILHSTWRHRRLLFATALLLRLASLALLWPLFGWLMRQLIATSGQDALTDQEIATFLLSPIGLTGAIGCLVVGVVILAMEQSSLLLQSFGLAQGYRVSIPAAILWSLRNLGSTALLCLAVIARTLLLLLPFLGGFGLVLWVLVGVLVLFLFVVGGGGLG